MYESIVLLAVCFVNGNCCCYSFDRMIWFVAVFHIEQAIADNQRSQIKNGITIEIISL
jgi:hypothetical protein